MTTEYITAWLSDQVYDYLEDDSPFEFPNNFDFDSTLEQLNERFNDQLVIDHLTELLNDLLKEINSKSN